MIKLFFEIVINYTKKLSVRNMYNTITDYSCACFPTNNNINKEMIKTN